MLSITARCYGSYQGIRCWVLLLGFVSYWEGLYSRQVVAQEAAKTIEQFVPADVTGALFVDDAAETGRQFQATGIGTMLASADWQPFRETILAANVPSIVHLRPWFGIDWSDLSQFSVPLSFVMLSDKPTESAAALIINTRRDPRAGEILRERAANYFQERGALVSNQPLRKGRRTSFQMPSSWAGSRSPVTLEQAGLLAFVTSATGAEALSRFWNQTTAPSLAQSEPYQQAIQTALGLRPEKHVIRVWLKPLSLVRTLSTTLQSPQRSRRDWLAIAERQGLDSVRAIGAILTVKSTGAPDFELAFSILAPRPYAKAFRMANLVPGSRLDPAPFISNSVASWSLIYQDVPQWFSGFGDLFDEFADPDNPGALRDILDAAKEDPEGPQIDIEKEIVGRLVSGLVWVRDDGATKSPRNPDGTREMYLLTVRESDQLQAVFKKYFQGDDLAQVSDIPGGMMWSTAQGHPLLLDTGETNRETITSLAVTDGRLWLCTDARWLRDAFTNPIAAKPLSGDKRFAEIVTLLGRHQAESDSLRSYIRLDQAWQSPYGHLVKTVPGESSDLRSQVLRRLLCNSKGPEPKQVFASLPPWTRVGPALGTSGILLRATPAGFEGYLVIIPSGADMTPGHP